MWEYFGRSQIWHTFALDLNLIDVLLKYTTSQKFLNSKIVYVF